MTPPLYARPAAPRHRRTRALLKWAVGVVPYTVGCMAAGGVVGLGLWTWACWASTKEEG